MRRFIPIVTLAIVAGLALPSAAHDPDARLSQIEREIHQLNDTIAAHQAQAGDLAQALAAAEQTMTGLRAELAAAQARVDAVQARIDTRQAQLVALGEQLDRLARELAETRVEILSTRDSIRDRAVDLYMGASLGMGGLILGFEDVSQAAVGMEYAGGILDESNHLLNSLQILEVQEQRQQEEIEAREGEVAAVLAELEQRRGELEDDLAAVEAAKAEVQAELDRQATLLAQTKAAIASAEQHKEGLEADAERIKAEIAARQQGGGTNPGILAWPVSGSVSSPFGYRIHPIFGTTRMHTGIDISAGYGASIRASGAGVVILAQWYGGYGNAVVIDHGGGLSTLYAHQSTVGVAPGQQVGTGDVIGYVGCTGFCTGPHVHFETRENGTPVDPMGYLGS